MTSRRTLFLIVGLAILSVCSGYVDNIAVFYVFGFSHQKQKIVPKSTKSIANRIIVTTKHGKVRGVKTPQGSEFLGIPYADPPVGSLRWKVFWMWFWHQHAHKLKLNLFSTLEKKGSFRRFSEVGRYQGRRSVCCNVLPVWYFLWSLCQLDSKRRLSVRTNNSVPPCKF